MSIQSEINRIAAAKAAIGAAIAGKGVTVPSGTTLDGMAALIESIAIGSVTPTYTNVIPQSVGSDGKPFNNGKGWISGYRINSSGSQVANSSYCVTGFIPVSSFDYIYLKNMNLVCGTEASDPNTRVALYDSSFKYITGKSVYTTLLTDTQFGGADGYILDDAGNVLGSADIGSGANIARMRIVYGSGDYYIRFSTKLIDDTSVVTINEAIV